MENEYFTAEERSAVLQSLKNLADVKVLVVDRDDSIPKGTLARKVDLSDREAFFAKAKLWRIIETIIVELFLKKLIAKELFFKDSDGTYYTVMPSVVGRG
uniref:Uncharacterized protein n=1 Tax=viral metagenome TaxID=1070528 RepID=A0A6M3LKZ4_9ZZZZ